MPNYDPVLAQEYLRQLTVSLEQSPAAAAQTIGSDVNRLARPIKARGLTDVQQSVVTDVGFATQILAGNPARRGFAVGFFGPKLFLSPQSLMAAGAPGLVLISGAPVYFRDVDWGDWVTQPWFATNNLGLLDLMTIYEEVYLT